MIINLLDLTNLDNKSLVGSFSSETILVYYFSSHGKITPDCIRDVFLHNNINVEVCGHLKFDNENHKGFISEYLEWLNILPNHTFLGVSLKKWFTFDNKFSLWWLTSSSQRKKNKTPLPSYMECVYLVRDIILKKLKDNENSNIVIIFDNETYKKLAYQAILAIQLEYSESDISIVVDDIQIRRTTITQYFKNILIDVHLMLNTWLKLIKLHQFLRKRFNFNSSSTHSNKVLLISDVSDISKHNGNLKNIYFPDIYKELRKRDIDLEAVYCHSNDIMSAKSWLNTRSDNIRLDGGNHYQYLYPGFFSLLQVLAASFKWLFTVRMVFLLGRWNSICQYHGVRMKPLIVSDFYKLTLRYGPLLCYYYLCWKKIIQRTKPLAVLYRKEFNSFGRVISAAAQPNTRMIGVQHGIVNSDQYGYLYKKEEIDVNQAAYSDFISKCPCPDTIAVFGTRMQRYMMSTGFPKDKIKIIGSLRHDSTVIEFPYPNTNLIKKNEFFSKFSIPDGKFIITLCCQWANVSSDWFGMIVEALMGLSVNAFLIVKPHPLELNETKNNIRSLSNKLNFFDYIFSDATIEEILYVSDVAITHSSTAGIDALLLGVPVISIHQDGLPNSNELFASSKSCFEVTDVSGMKNTLNIISSAEFDRESWNQSRNSFLERNLSNIDSNAHDRLVELCKP